MENQVRELLRDIAEDIPPLREVPSTLRPRARRRIAATVAMTVVVACAVAVGGMAAVRSITESSPLPADPGPTIEPTPLGAGEVLTGGSQTAKTDLLAEDPDSGEMRTVVDAEALPGRTEGISGAAWSSDRRWVAFRAGGLWVADTIGGDPRQVTADQGWFPWAWSPTEDQLAVVHGRDVTLFDAVTGGETDLGSVVGPEDSEGYAVHNLVWSPDGERLAYDAGPGWDSVYSIDVASGEHSMLVPPPAGTGEIKDIDWSPDGAHLAISYVDRSYIASHEEELGPVAYKATALYVANADGSSLRLLDRIVSSDWGVWIPGLSVGTAWSPDGTRLVYTTFSGPEHRELQVWTVSGDGSEPELVASQCCLSDGGTPVWSPDGSQIAFEAETGGGTDALSLEHLVVNADGTGGLRQIDELAYRSWLGGWYFCRCYG